jgi:hypothetical protein
LAEFCACAPAQLLAFRFSPFPFLWVNVPFSLSLFMGQSFSAFASFALSPPCDWIKLKLGPHASKKLSAQNVFPIS